MASRPWRSCARGNLTLMVRFKADFMVRSQTYRVTSAVLFKEAVLQCCFPSNIHIPKLGYTLKIIRQWQGIGKTSLVFHLPLSRCSSPTTLQMTPGPSSDHATSLLRSIQGSGVCITSMNKSQKSFCPTLKLIPLSLLSFQLHLYSCYLVSGKLQSHTLFKAFTLAAPSIVNTASSDIHMAFLLAYLGLFSNGTFFRGFV